MCPRIHAGGDRYRLVLRRRERRFESCRGHQAKAQVARALTRDAEGNVAGTRTVPADGNEERMPRGRSWLQQPAVAVSS
jgi:hypothetical protein